MPWMNWKYSGSLVFIMKDQKFYFSPEKGSIYLDNLVIPSIHSDQLIKLTHILYNMIYSEEIPK